MGFLSKAFKKVKPASMARQASGKMGKRLFGKFTSKAVTNINNKSGDARMQSSEVICSSLKKLLK